MRRLRRLGQVTTYFAEDDQARLSRLLAYEREHVDPDLALKRGHDTIFGAQSDRRGGAHGAGGARQEREDEDDDGSAAGADLGAGFAVDGANAPSKRPRLEAASLSAAAADGSRAGEGSADAEEDDEEEDDGAIVDAVEGGDRASSAAGGSSGGGARGPGAKSSGDRFTRASSLQHRGKDAHKFMYAFYKGLLHEWEADIEVRREALQATAVGRQEVAVCRQARDYLRPFFKHCRNRTLPDDICAGVSRMAERLSELDFRGAADAYVAIAVGNQPWLIGVSQVGIHERAAREKVYQGKITHVLNDEVQRRYITSLKRLATFLQAREEGMVRGHLSHPAAM